MGADGCCPAAARTEAADETASSRTAAQEAVRRMGDVR
jgi:hypothetical protein